MKNKIIIAAAVSLFLLSAVSCSSENEDTVTVSESVSYITAEISESTEAAVTSEAAEDMVASADEMVTPENIVDENMLPVYAESLKDGIYDITVDSSSSMFNITSCSLTVSEGKMEAVMTMSGKGYLYLFMGKGEAAVNADEGSYIPFEENENGGHCFKVPVEALDMGIDCTAFSKNKEKWYDRVILFRADSLPAEAFGNDFFTTAETLGLEDGEYTADVSLSGGSGRASVKSPADITVSGEKMTAVIEWSSSNYDYMIVNDEKYLPVNTDGNSVFEIPVSAFDYNIPVRADTTAMSTPHEIEYTLLFSSESLAKK